MYQDKKGFLWLITRHQLLRFDPATQQTEDFTAQFMQSGAGYFQIECLYEDAADQLWVGSYFGVYKFNNQESLFSTIALPAGIGDNPYFSTRGLLESPGGHLLIGSYSGFYAYNRSSNTFKEYKVKVDDHWANPLARAMVAGAGGKVWMATEGLGLLLVDPGKPAHPSYFDKPGDTTRGRHLPVSSHNYSLLEDNDGRLWMGGYDNLYLLDPRTGNTQRIDLEAGPKKYARVQVLAIHQGRDRTLWAGTDYGLFRIDKSPGVPDRYGSPAVSRVEAVGDLVVTCLYEDKKGRLWLGTKGEGIRVFNPENGRVEAQYTARDGLADDRVCAILPGADNQFWISTYTGLSCLSLPGGSFRNFHTSDGLLTDEFNQGSALAGRDGNLYFGSIDGIVYFDPRTFPAGARNGPGRPSRALRPAGPAAPSGPVAVVPAVVPEEVLPAPPPPAGAAAPLVLVVEDHDDMRAFIAQGLAGTCRVLLAANGLEGWQMAQEELPDLVIADVSMPGMDGFALSHLIKNTPLTAHVAVTLLTARTAAEARVQGLASGANDYLTKPFNVQELQLRAANWFSYQQTLRGYWHQRFGPSPAGAEPVALPATPADDPFLREVYQVLDRELANAAFAVDELAAEMRVSTRTLHRKVRALTDLNANTLMRSYRLGKAAVLLREGLPVSEVAERVGFEGLSYFSKCFREQFSVSPSQYASRQNGL